MATPICQAHAALLTNLERPHPWPWICLYHIYSQKWTSIPVSVSVMRWQVSFSVQLKPVEVSWMVGQFDPRQLKRPGSGYLCVCLLVLHSRNWTWSTLCMSSVLIVDLNFSEEKQMKFWGCSFWSYNIDAHASRVRVAERPGLNCQTVVSKGDHSK
jgi:hypothetical protein